jgi:vacuolar-type H+-ATPase subunit E/Vma4
MEIQFLIDRILKDANAEAAEILKEAKKNAKENLEYAKKNQEELLKDAKENHKKNQTREKEISQSEQKIKENLALLSAKTKIVDEVFKKAIDGIKFNFRVEQGNGYELRLTRSELETALRDEIEAKVVEILFA